MKAQVVKVDGSKVEVEPKNGKHFSLAEMRTAIGGGYVEKINLGYMYGGERVLMFVDEDGHMKQLPRNEQASMLADSEIVGDVLICLAKQVS